ncbi:MAG: hypothetical protein ACREP9_19215 [Candidatus Dormibacteraceae bacterium]
MISPTDTDEQSYETAQKIEQAHPHWMVVWGLYSREYWAFPLLDVPRGTIVHATDPDMLVAAIEDVELAAAHSAEPGW